MVRNRQLTSDEKRAQCLPELQVGYIPREYAVLATVCSDTGSTGFPSTGGCYLSSL